MAQQTAQHRTVYLQWDRHGHYVGKLSAPAYDIAEWRRRVSANGGYTVEAGAPADTAGTPWTCACAFINFDGGEACGGCHLTRFGQGEPTPPCTCGCDPTPGRYGTYDTLSSASRRHFIDTGRFLRPGENLAAD